MSDTKPSAASEPADVTAFLESIEHPTRRSDAFFLNGLFRKITGFAPYMAGASIIGYGRYHYTYASGRTGVCQAAGFSPRKGALSIYIMPGYQDYREILTRLGKHRTGAACLYVNKLADVDMAVLEELIRSGLIDLAKIWPVEPT